MLGLTTGWVVKCATALHFGLAQLQRTHHPRKAGIRDVVPVFSLQEVMHPRHVAIEAQKQLANQRCQGFIAAGTLKLSGGFAVEDASDGLARHLHQPADLTDAVAGSFHCDDSLSVGFVSHG